MGTHVRTLLVAGVLWSAGTAMAAPPQRGDVLVAEQVEGAILVVDPESGNVRGVLSGADIVNNGPGATGADDVGSGPALSGFAFDVVSVAGRDVYVSLSSGNFTQLLAIDVFTGERRMVNDPAAGPAWFEYTKVIQETPTSLLMAESSSVYRFDLETRTSTLVSGHDRGDGPTMFRPADLALLDNQTLLVSDAPHWNVLFSVDLATGDRGVVSFFGNPSGTTDLYIDGEDVGRFDFADLEEPGEGPFVGGSFMDLCVVDGRAYLTGFGNYLKGPQLFEGGVIDVDLASGDRELVFGTAYEGADGLMLGPVLRDPPSNAPGLLFEKADDIKEGPDGRLWFVDRYSSGFVYAYDVSTDEIEVLSHIGPQLAPGWSLGSPNFDLRFPGFAVYTGTVCTQDLDGDGNVGLNDFGTFSAAFGSMTGDANYDPRADFDGDGDVDLSDFGVFGAAFGRTDCLD